MSNFTRPPELAIHPVTISLPVQWGDQDAFNHVNNVVYYRWMESARIEYFRQVGLGVGISPQGIGPILASLRCDFRRQLAYPETVLISSSIASIGRTSLKMVHFVYSTAQQTIAAEGDSVIVMFDYRAQKPLVVSDEIRAAIDSLERSNKPRA